MPALRLRLLAIAAAIGVVACSSAEERGQEARTRAREALGRGERTAAVVALREASPDEEPPEAVLEHAGLLATAGETAQAVWLLESSLRRFPERADLRVSLGQLQLQVNDAAAAREAARGVPAGSEHHPAALLVQAQAELMLGSLENALEVLEEAERLYPDRLEARLARASVLAQEGRLPEARALLDEVKRLQHTAPNEVQQVVRRIDVGLYAVQVQQGKADAATLAGLRALVAEDPADPQAWGVLVQALAREGKAREGLEGLEKAIAEDPERLGLYPLVASLRAAAGDVEGAEEILRQLIGRSPTAMSYVQLARFHAGRRDEKRALEAWVEGVAALPDDPILARSHVEALLDAGRLDDAGRELERFRKLAQEDPHGEFLQARLELAQGNAAGAVARLEKLVPELDHPFTQHWLGRALEAQGDLAGAERRYALAVGRNPHDPILYPALIRLAERRGDWRNAAGAAEVLVRRAPGQPEGWTALAGALVNLGSGEQAEKVARQFAERFPDRADAGLFVARALRARGQHAPALEELTRAQQRFGSSPELEAERALTLGMAGRLQEGIDLLGPALEASPDSPLLHSARASLLFAAGKGDEGSREVDRALELDPEDPRPLRVRAEFRAATGRFEDARADCERYLKERPDDAGALFMLGVAEQGLGRLEEAMTAYRRAAKLDEQAFRPRNNLAVLLAKSDLQGALAAAQEAYALAPKDADILDTLGWLYLEAGRADRSIQLLEDARRAAPGNAETGLHLALAYRAAGRSDDARRLLLALRDGADGAQRAQVEDALRSLP